MKRWYRIVPMFMSAVLAAGNIPVTLYASQAAADVIIEETMDAPDAADAEYVPEGKEILEDADAAVEKESADVKAQEDEGIKTETAAEEAAEEITEETNEEVPEEISEEVIEEGYGGQIPAEENSAPDDAGPAEGAAAEVQDDNRDIAVNEDASVSYEEKTDVSVSVPEQEEETAEEETEGQENAAGATITATSKDDSNVKASCVVTVKQPVTKVTLQKTASLDRGKTLTLKAAVLPASANNKNIKWTTSNVKVATVSQKGVIKGIQKGKATITATATDGSGVKASCTVTVSQPAVTEKTEESPTPSQPIVLTDSLEPVSPAESEELDEQENSTGSENNEDESKPSESEKPSEPEKPVHIHTWENITKVIHHNEEGHFEKRQTGTKTVVDEEA